MTSERDRAFVTFNGNAIATSEEIVIKADAIDLFLYTPDEKKSRARTGDPDTDQNINQNIKEIIARGNVRFTSEEHRAFADRAVYTTTTEILVLTGDAPRVITGKSYVTGKKITLFQKNGKVIVESGNNQRVEALFNAEDSKSGTESDKNSAPKKDKEGE
jgi:lipopolysaccharide export system protein LptA